MFIGSRKIFMLKSRLTRRLDVATTEGQKAIEELLDSDMLMSESDIDDSFDDPDYVEKVVSTFKPPVAPFRM